MYAIFSRNGTASLLLSALLLVALRLPMLLEPAVYVRTPNSLLTPGPLWTSTLGALQPGLLPVLLSWLVVLATALLLGRLVHDNALSVGATNLPVWAYVVLSGGLVRSLTWQPSQLYALLLACVLLLLFTATRRRRPHVRVAWALALMGLGTLLWAPTLWSLPLPFLALFTLRLTSPRCLVAAFLGLAAVAVMGLAAALLAAPRFEVVQAFWLAAQTPITSELPRLGYVYLATVLLVGLVAALATAAGGSLTGVVEGRKMSICRWVALLAVAFYALPWFCFCLQNVAAVGLAAVVPAWLADIRSHLLREAICWLLVAVTAIMCWSPLM